MMSLNIYTYRSFIELVEGTCFSTNQTHDTTQVLLDTKIKGKVHLLLVCTCDSISIKELYRSFVECGEEICFQPIKLMLSDQYHQHHMGHFVYYKSLPGVSEDLCSQNLL